MKIERVQFNSAVQSFFMRNFAYEPVTEYTLGRIELEIADYVEKTFRRKCKCSATVNNISGKGKNSNGGQSVLNVNVILDSDKAYPLVYNYRVFC